MDESAEILATLGRIEGKLTEQCKEIARLNAQMFGNGRRGMLERVSTCEEMNAGIFKWIAKHEKNVKWWAVITISILALITSLFGSICYGGII